MDLIVGVGIFLCFILARSLLADWSRPSPAGKNIDSLRKLEALQCKSNIDEEKLRELRYGVEPGQIPAVQERLDELDAQQWRVEQRDALDALERLMEREPGVLRRLLEREPGVYRIDLTGIYDKTTLPRQGLGRPSERDPERQEIVDPDERRGGDKAVHLERFVVRDRFQAGGLSVRVREYPRPLAGCCSFVADARATSAGGVDALGRMEATPRPRFWLACVESIMLGDERELVRDASHLVGYFVPRDDSPWVMLRQGFDHVMAYDQFRAAVVEILLPKDGAAQLPPDLSTPRH
jgi:hypothetical protein